MPSVLPASLGKMARFLFTTQIGLPQAQIPACKVTECALEKWLMNSEEPVLMFGITGHIVLRIYSVLPP